MIGRDFMESDGKAGAPPVVLIGHRMWTTRFDGDASVVGREVRLNGVMTTVVGVMPEKFGFPEAAEVWLPFEPLAFPRGAGQRSKGTQLQAVARLKPGVTVEQAQAEMTTIAGRLAAAYPASNQGIGVSVMRLIDTFIGPQDAAMLYTMLGAVFAYC